MDRETSGGSAHYDWLGFYHDRNDTRLFVSRQNWIMGWTINLEHRLGPAVLWALAGGILVAILLGAGPHSAYHSP